MKPSVLFALTMTFLVGCATDQTAEIQRLNAELAELRASAPAPLPKSLENFFPPKAEAPLWQIQMHNMVTPLMASVGKLMAGDVEKGTVYFEEFKEQYVATSAMVPEWTPRFDMAPVASVDAALATGDAEASVGAIMSLTDVCHNCHYENMVRVQQLYHWPKFSEVKVNAPDGRELALTEVMQGVEMPLVGIGISLQEGFSDEARQNLEMFKQSFALLEESCEECHESERTYFVDEMVQNLVGRLERALSDPSPNAEAVGNLLQGIGEESCFKCHLVHVPAAMTQRAAAHADAAMGSH